MDNPLLGKSIFEVSLDVLRSRGSLVLAPLWSCLATTAMMGIELAGVQILARLADGALATLLRWLLDVAFMFAVLFVITFFEACVVLATRAHLDGSPCSFAMAARLGVAHIPSIARWTLATTIAFEVMRESLIALASVVPQPSVGLVITLTLVWSTCWLGGSLALPAILDRRGGAIEAYLASCHTLLRGWRDTVAYLLTMLCVVSLVAVGMGVMFYFTGYQPALLVPETIAMFLVITLLQAFKTVAQTVLYCQASASRPEDDYALAP